MEDSVVIRMGRYLGNMPYLKSPYLVEIDKTWNRLDQPSNDKREDTGPQLLDTDASHQGLGAVLCQDEDVWNEKKQEFIPTPKPVAFANRVLREAEVLDTRVKSDAQVLKWLMSTPEPSERFGWWAIRIQSEAFKIIYRQSRLNCVADALSRASLATEDIPADDYLETKEPTRYWSDWNGNEPVKFYHPDDPVDSSSKEEIKSTELSGEGEEYLMLDDEQKKKTNEKFSKEFKEKAKGFLLDAQMTEANTETIDPDPYAKIVKFHPTLEEELNDSGAGFKAYIPPTLIS
uniref:Reverse transcriptase/retrotransposon-derived protein RNase H-like domain-containing protein n=1 Tax=Strigamia maritima TaxID=126957 RepID=T1J2D6_STRMM